MSANRKITMRQLQILIILSAMGTGVIVLPRRAADFLPNGVQDAWAIALGLTVFALIAGALISTAARAVQKAAIIHRGDTGEGGEQEDDTPSFFQSVAVVLSKPVAIVLGVVLWGKLVFAAGLELRIFLEISRDVMLPNTPLPVIGAVMLLTCAYAATKGMETRARVAEVLFALMILPFLFLFVVALFDSDFSNLQPVLVNDVRSLVYGSVRLGFILTGLECLLLVSPYVPQKRSLRKAVVGALCFAGIIITAITAITIMSFGSGVADEPWPVLSMMDVINLPGAFIERQEALMFGFWIITAFAVGNAMLFFGGIIVRDVVKGTGLRTGVAITTVAVFAISIVPFSREEIYARIDYMYMTTGLFFVIVLPIILIIASKITIWGGEKTKKKLARTSTMILIPLLSMALLSGCWDKVEIENRAFVVAMGIDKGENENYAITLSIPILNKEDEDEKPAHVNTAEGETLLAALKKLDAKNDKNLYYGQTKLVVLGTEILENKELLEAAINTLEDKLEATRRIHVVAAKSPEKILATKPPGEILPGSYIPNMYRDKDKIGGASFTLDFERLSTKSSKVAIVPKIEAEEDELKLSGAAVLENSKKTGLLSPEELQGYLWAFCGGNQGAVITAENNSSLAVEKHKTQITFRSAKPAPRVTIDVHVTGKLYGNHPANFETIIAQELSQTAHLLQTTHQTDGYNWLQLLRKKNYPLYKKHAENWDEIFPKLEIIPRVTVEIL